MTVRRPDHPERPGRARRRRRVQRSQGGGIHAEDEHPRRRNSVVQHNTASPAQGGGGGIFAAGDLFVSTRSCATTARRRASWWATTTAAAASAGPGADTLDSDHRQLDLRQHGDRGRDRQRRRRHLQQRAADLSNVTFSGNRHWPRRGAAGGGGGGILVKTAGGSIEHATFFGNHSDRAGGALAGSTTTLANSLFHANSAPANPDCAAGSADSAQGNIESTSAPTCDPVAGRPGRRRSPARPARPQRQRQRHADPRHPRARQPGRELRQELHEPQDQRGVSRYQTCDSGAYEFDGNTTADVPDCSPTGVIPLALDSAPGGTVVGLSYKVNGGPEIQSDTGDSGQPLTPTSVTFQEGRGDARVLGPVDERRPAGPRLPERAGRQDEAHRRRREPDGESIFVITRRERVNVSAADALSGLVQDPSATGVRVDTGTARRRDVRPHRDRPVREPGERRVRLPRAGPRSRRAHRARARPRNGPGAEARRRRGAREPEGPAVHAAAPAARAAGRSFIDARRGTARLTSARTRREDQIQDGLFSKGVFQVLQSRRVRRRGSPSCG